MPHSVNRNASIEIYKQTGLQAETKGVTGTAFKLHNASGNDIQPEKRGSQESPCKVRFSNRKKRKRREKEGVSFVAELHNLGLNASLPLLPHFIDTFWPDRQVL